MSYLSLDVSQKITMSDVKGYGNHVYRKTKKVKNHSNKEIDVSRTNTNMDFTFADMSFDERFKKRFADYKATKKDGTARKLRKDAVVLRGFVLQASSDVFDGLDASQQSEKMNSFVLDSYAFLANQFGADNVIGLSAHMDESNPHLHAAIMPMTADGRLSQKDFFKGPEHLRQLHKDYREHMNAKGWSFETENKYEDAKRFSEAEYKRNAPAIEVARKEHTEKKRQLSTDSNLRDEVKKELLLDDELRNEAKQELRDELEPALKSSVRRSVEDEYKTIRDDLNAREEQIQASEDGFYEKQRMIRERFELEQEAERQKIEVEKEQLRRKEKALAERETRFGLLKQQFEQRVKKLEGNIYATFSGKWPAKVVMALRGEEAMSEHDKMLFGLHVDARKNDVEDGLAL